MNKNGDNIYIAFDYEIDNDNRAEGLITFNIIDYYKKVRDFDDLLNQGGVLIEVNDREIPFEKFKILNDHFFMNYTDIYGADKWSVNLVPLAKLIKKEYEKEYGYIDLETCIRIAWDYLDVSFGNTIYDEMLDNLEMVTNGIIEYLIYTSKGNENALNEILYEIQEYDYFRG